MSGDAGWTVSRGALAAGATFLVLAVGASFGAYRAGGALHEARLGPPPAPSAAATAAPVAAPAVDGAALYAANCAGCHGRNAEGGVGPKLAGLAADLTAFTKAVLDGRGDGGRTLAPVMPHFRDVGFGGRPPSDAELKALHESLRAR